MWNVENKKLNNRKTLIVFNFILNGGNNSISNAILNLCTNIKFDNLA